MSATANREVPAMADISIKETCACGATFACNGTTYRSAAGGGTNTHHRGAEEMAERWRIEHKHIDPAPLPMVERRVPMSRPRLRVRAISSHRKPHDSESRT